MSSVPNLDGLSPDVREEIECLAMRVTQGIPAYRSLRAVLTEAEWAEIEPELKQYFPPAAEKEDPRSARQKAGRPSRTANAPPGEPTASVCKSAVEPTARPPYYAIKTLVKVRQLSECRAILELALATDLLSEASYRRLLREIGELSAARPVGKPEWDRSAGELRFGGKVVKRVRGPRVAKNVVTVLDAFQEEGWPRHIDDPLPDGRKQKRLHDTVWSLNEDLEVIRFRADGSGEGFCWNLV